MEMSIVSMDFLAALGSLILLDLLLGGDNAVVIAMAANKLSPELRRKAVFIGTAGAVVIRLVMTLIAVWLLTIPYLQAIGGLILLPIAVKLLVPADETGDVKAADNLVSGSQDDHCCRMRPWALTMFLPLRALLMEASCWLSWGS
jgi:predicted tellurium resistance membrane protein TerC